MRHNIRILKGSGSSIDQEFFWRKGIDVNPAIYRSPGDSSIVQHGRRRRLRLHNTTIGHDLRRRRGSWNKVRIRVGFNLYVLGIVIHEEDLEFFISEACVRVGFDILQFLPIDLDDSASLEQGILESKLELGETIVFFEDVDHILGQLLCQPHVLRACRNELKSLL